MNETPQNGLMIRMKPFSKTLKFILIGILVMLMSIPMIMVSSLIDDRENNQRNAIEEVQQKWSKPQKVWGPYLDFEYTQVEKNDSGRVEKNIVKRMLLPDELLIEGDLKTEIRSRSIYDVNVYQTELTMKGTFSMDELKKHDMDLNQLNWDKAAVCMNVSDLRGVCEQVMITIGDSVYSMESGTGGKGMAPVGLHTFADLSMFKGEQKITFETKMRLKGSSNIHFVPLGKNTEVNLKANWGSPSFVGDYLPDEREISKETFIAHWKVLNLNRNYPQVLSSGNSEITHSSFGVDLLVPVNQYQQTTRSVKYAFLVICLTFVVVFLSEILCKVHIHVLQYLLVGLALCLFYSLLLSFSEHVGFDWAYLIASIMTVTMVGGYMKGIIKQQKTALVMAGLLSVLYLYIWVLIQLETFALLVGSLGLFFILAALMYFSRRMD